MRRLALTFLLATPVLAHDLWIEPSSFRPAPGDVVTASLKVGVALQGEAVVRIPPLVERFALKGTGPDIPLVGRPGSDPAGAARVIEPGPAWLGYQSRASLVTLEGLKFEEYLKEEGLTKISEERARKGQSAAPARERFFRCAKALLDGPGPEAVVLEPLGFTLELLPRKNPYRMAAGDELAATLTFRGKPLANALVVAMSRKDPAKTVRATTNARGEVSLRLPHPGFWLVKAVHMEAAPAGAPVEWESWWASLTFDLPEKKR